MADNNEHDHAHHDHQHTDRDIAERARRIEELRGNLSAKLDELHRRAVNAKEVLTPARYLTSGWVRIGLGVVAGIAVAEAVRAGHRTRGGGDRRARSRSRGRREVREGGGIGEFASDVALSVLRAGLVAGIVAFGKSVIAKAAASPDVPDAYE